MSRRTSRTANGLGSVARLAAGVRRRRLGAAALLALVGCGGGAAARTIDVCAREPGLADALRGGELRLLVQTAAGELVARGSAPPDRPGTAALDGARAGDLVIVEGVDAGGAPIALGSATLDERVGCVCLVRRSWRALGTWADAGGAAHFGLHGGFFVGTPPPGLVPRPPLALDRGRVVAGDRLVASFGVTNTAATTRSVQSLQVLARPPGATHAQGLYTDFTAQPARDLEPGATFTAQATRTFGAGDPSGVWAIFVRATDALGAAHDGPELEVLVGAGSEPLLPATPLRLGASWVAAGESLHGDAMLENPGGAPVAYASAVLTARAPGRGDDEGPFYDFSNPATGQVPAGGGLSLSGDRRFGIAEDPCAGVVCTVRDGACAFAPAP